MKAIYFDLIHKFKKYLRRQVLKKLHVQDSAGTGDQ